MSGFWVEFRKEIYNEEYLKSIGLNSRQIKGIIYLKEKGRISNNEYQHLNNCSRNTASNDLSKMVKEHLIVPSGQRGAGAFYTLNKIAQ